MTRRNETPRTARTMTLLLCAAPLLWAVAWLAGPTTGEPGGSPVAAGAQTAAPSATPAVGVASEPRRAAAAGIYGAPAGTELTFAIAARSQTAVGHVDGGPSTTIGYSIDGKMHLGVVRRRADELIVRVVCPDVAVRSEADGVSVDRGADPAAALERDLALPTLVRMAPDGQTRGYRFADAMRNEHRNWVRALVSALRFVVPGDAGDRWSCEESDAAGRYRAEYRWLERPVELEKRKPSGIGRAHLDLATGWIDEASWREESEHTVDGVPLVFRSAFSCTFRLENRAHGLANAASLELDPDLDWQPTDGHADVAHLAERREREQFAERLRGVTLEQLIAECDALARAGGLLGDAGFEHRNLLSWLIRLRPDALARLDRAVSDPGLHPSALRAIVAAVGGAQTEAAQQTLAGWLRDPAVPGVARRAAALSTFQLERPGRPVVDALLAAIDAAAGSGDPELAAQGLLALGAVASRDGGEHAFAELLAREATCRERGNLELWLEALGNAGRPGSVAVAARYLANDEAALRAAAVSALRRLDDAAANQLLVRTLEDDLDPEVRARAAELLAGRAVPAAIAALERLLHSEPLPAVRRVALLALGQRAAADATAARLLRDAASRDRDPELRALAAELLGRS